MKVRGRVGKSTHNRVTTRYWANVASVVPRDWTANATRIAHAIEALAYILVFQHSIALSSTQDSHQTG